MGIDIDKLVKEAVTDGYDEVESRRGLQDYADVLSTLKKIGIIRKYQENGLDQSRILFWPGGVIRLLRVISMFDGLEEE